MSDSVRSDGSRMIPALDGLRGIAILLVLWCHSAVAAQLHGLRMVAVLGTFAQFSYVGVDLFFVLSGFLLFLPYARAILVGGEWPSARRFYIRRARRILPAYYAVIAPLSVILLALIVAGHWYLLGALSAAITLMYDLRVTTWNVVAAYDSPLWSLTVEWQFYLLLPWIALALAKFVGNHKRRERRLMLALVLLIMLGLALRAAATFVHYRWGGTSIGAPDVLAVPYGLLYGTKGKCIELFGLGMLASTIYTAGRERGWAVLRMATLQLVIGVLTIGMAACAVWARQTGRLSFAGFYYPPSATDWPWAIFGDWCISICFAVLLTTVLFSEHLKSALSLAPLRFTGRISYSVYVWHMLLIVALLTDGTLLRIALVWIVVLACGTLSYVVIERPFLGAYPARLIRPGIQRA